MSLVTDSDYQEDQAHSRPRTVKEDIPEPSELINGQLETEDKSRYKKPVQCPFCYRLQGINSHNLLCGPCNHESLEIIRNSVIENDRLNELSRSEIDDIFRIYFQIKQGNLNEVVAMSNLDRQLTRSKNSDENSNIPYASVKSIKFLSLQLLKLEIINEKLKLKNIERSKQATSSKISYLRTDIEKQANTIDSERTKINEKEHQIIDNFNKTNYKITSQISEYKHEKTYQIEKQACQLQASHFKVLKDIVFSHKLSSNKYTSIITTKIYKQPFKTSRLLFFDQPILSIQDLLKYNNKVISINEFFENLIRLQIQLLDIFKIGNNFMHLPYLVELKNYLPDSSFHDLVQEKENFMTSGGNISPDDSSNEEKSPVSPTEIKEINVDNERIIKLGDEIKLPLSSKTINYQLRRASVNGSNKNDAKAKSLLPSAPEPERNINNSEDKLGDQEKKNKDKNYLKGKRMVIIPHKILTKPFTKLTTKEYLKFLLVIVKIIVNFKTFFALTIDSLPTSHSQQFQQQQHQAQEHGIRKKTSSSTLSSTINQFRFNLNHHNTNEKPSEDGNPLNDNSMYDFEQILEKIANMESFFNIKLGILEQKKNRANELKKTYPGSYSSLPSHYNTNSTTSSSLNESPKEASNVSVNGSLISTPTSSSSSAMNSIIKSDIEKLDRDRQNHSRESPLKSLYTNIFQKSKAHLKDYRDPQHDEPDGLSTDVYGNISETHGNARSSSANLDPFSNINIPESPEWDRNPDLKVIMQKVYQLMANGTGPTPNQIAKTKSAAINPRTTSAQNSTKNQQTSGNNIGIDTLKMMAQSKVQLDDWDVISKMY